MQIISDRKAFKRGVLLYRKIRYRKGHGVHSPFVFNFITKVIDERAAYYCLKDIELTRKKFFYENEPFHKWEIRPKYGALLMRISNYLKPQNLLLIGSDLSFSALYSSSYASTTRCVVLEEKTEIAAFSRSVIEKHRAKNILLKEGVYQKTVSEVLEHTDKLDFVYFGYPNDSALDIPVFECILPHLHEHSVLILRGIRKTKDRKEFWNRLCARPEVSVTIDVYELGIAFFNHKIHKKNYIVSF
ncbi:MAG: SAM-dependent methyltransferase [Massilibacteroides sp.]|nr:SAM-dependent methyltransferase [Massilibacteroides sp.]MDD3061968.1 SAM-dependent methyltransferase [Massilibacteroides sp.]MDD4115986.1 SAM-dependent methyltransferase [Massilibacteroides sp.]MDD4659315.1 SAM-dependent methyltransferase [Massilibacteroides sp.]